MANDLFRFHTIRAPQPRCDAEGGVVELYPEGRRSDFLRDLRRARNAAGVTAIVTSFIDAPRFVSTGSTLPTDVPELADALFRTCKRISLDGGNEVIERLLHLPAPLVAETQEYLDARARIADSLLAVSLLEQSQAVRDHLLVLMRTCGIIELFAARYPEPPRSPRAVNCTDLAAKLIIVLPAEARAGQQMLLSVGREQSAAFTLQAVPASAVAAATADVTATRAALDELLTLADDFYQKAAYAPGMTGGLDPKTSEDRRLSAASTKGLQKQIDKRKKEVKSIFKDSVMQATTRGTRTLLKQAGILLTPETIPVAVSTMERRLALDHRKLSQARQSQNSAVVQRNKLAIQKGLATKQPLTADFAINAEAAQGAPQSAGNVSPVGVADLLVVRQRVLKYELGEIAYIENAARGSNKERTHRRLDTMEQIVFTETERTEATERDLQVSERFALHNEVSSTISEKLTANGELRVEGSYGPSVKITATASVGYTRSSEQSTKVASDYAKDVIDRSTSRIQLRELTRTQTTTRQEVEETSKYGINNVGGLTHDKAIYRWVEKVLEAHIVNYGRRLLFEFVIPDPAVFYRYCMANPILEPISVPEPEPPTYSDATSGVTAPLSPEHLTIDNYLEYVGKYQVPNVEAPPETYSYVGTQLTCTENDTSSHIHVAPAEVAIPTGYVAEAAYTAWSAHRSDTDDWLINIRIGDKEINLKNGLSCDLKAHDKTISVGGRFKYIRAAVVNVVIRTKRTDGLVQKWRMATFNAIIIAYNKMKSAYDDAVRARTANANQPPGVFASRSPTRNREIEREELKRSAINIITAQNYEMFNAVSLTVPPLGYPEINLAELDAEGPYIQFLEQAFEWNNMSYVLYPYFWSNKTEWDITSQLDSDDPLFGRFLRAGAARVQVPARPGFEDAILYFFETNGGLWNGASAPPHIGDPMYVSMVQEIRDQSGDAFLDARGTLTLTQGSDVVVTTLTDITEDDEGRIIRVGGKHYQIAEWVSPTEIRLTLPFDMPDIAGAQFALGPKIVGLPWEVRLPMSVVMLQDDGQLPSWESVKTWV